MAEHYILRCTLFEIFWVLDLDMKQISQESVLYRTFMIIKICQTNIIEVDNISHGLVSIENQKSLKGIILDQYTK